MPTPKLRADFNGLFGDILCLSHYDTSTDEYGIEVPLRAGITAIAYDEDIGDNGERDDLIAVGTIEESPDWLQCRGSKWILRIDRNGVRHESEIT